ncbi:conserved hypothetical protein [Ricinus communis]|uniref:TRF2/HOY1 PH-like domain-containing protein n=1 Tax=Ricinus communis TaxID=3988 RepID=B9RGP4_RICCO|nr:conserved hypothetical protein [Ricinus communis]|eukprot:XP_002512753.1 uncharacterized protein LOC8280273 [Ricinus communis]
MVQLMNNSSTRIIKKSPVKLELDDSSSLEDQLGPLHKRSKFDYSSSSLQMIPAASLSNPLEEPSPLGLRLKKSPSFLDLIQMKLSQAANNPNSKKDQKTAVITATDKLKASNFPATLLRIGNWEYKSRHEGDLVAKCYFAKHKLVWEVLDGGLKNKIEIQWSDIVAIKANFPDDGPETLDVVLARQPLFFRETNPQPRKHTLWQATSDFTGGQASLHKQHFLQCQQGFLGKHFEKLIQCDPRLNFLSHQPKILLESPYFEQRLPQFGDLNESAEVLEPKAEERPAVFALGDAASPVLSSSLSDEHQFFIGRTPESISRETPSPSSDAYGIREFRSLRADRQMMPSHWNQIKVPGLHQSMSMSDFVNHIGQCISEQMTTGNPTILDDETKYNDILEEITQYLLSDYQLTSASDEQSLMSRVNSLCCLLQKDPGSARNLQARSSIDLEIDGDGRKGEAISNTMAACQSKAADGFPLPEDQLDNVSSCKQAPAMSRKDSIGDLLLNLPRIASLPQFLYNI